MGYVYRHIRLDTNEPFYIGIGLTEDPKYKRAFSKQGRSELWRRITNKTSYSVQIVLDDLTEEETKEKEKEFIKIYGRIDLGTGTLCNFTAGGDGTPGNIQSEEQKRATSERMMGENNPMFGKYGEENPMFGINHTEETKNKISEKAKGRIPSEETRDKIRNANLGKKRTDETKAKLSNSLKGENNPNWGKSPSEETREKLRIAITGMKRSEETKQKIREANSGENSHLFGKYGVLNHNFGRKAAQELKDHLSKIRKGTKMGADNPKSKLVLNKETGVFYGSALEAHRELSLKMSERKFTSMLNNKCVNETPCIYA